MLAGRSPFGRPNVLPSRRKNADGASTQFKNGNLGLWGNILLAANGGSYFNFGATSGSDGYGIRENLSSLTEALDAA
jgi:hypothetical protein